MRVLVGVACAFVLAGCVTKEVPLDTASVQVQGKTLAVVEHSPSRLDMLTTKDAMVAGLFGPIGAGLSAIETAKQANKILQDNQIADPTAQVRSTVAQALATNRGLQIVHAGVPAPANKDAWFRTYAGADYLLDVKTWYWGVLYLPTRWDRYQIQYQVDLRMFDAATRKPVAQGKCKVKPVDVKTAPTFEEMFENGAARFKGYMEKAVADCTDSVLKAI